MGRGFLRGRVRASYTGATVRAVGHLPRGSPRVPPGREGDGPPPRWIRRGPLRRGFREFPPAHEFRRERVDPPSRLSGRPPPVLRTEGHAKPGARGRPSPLPSVLASTHNAADARRSRFHGRLRATTSDGAGTLLHQVVCLGHRDGSGAGRARMGILLGRATAVPCGPPRPGRPRALPRDRRPRDRAPPPDEPARGTTDRTRARLSHHARIDPAGHRSGRRPRERGDEPIRGSGRHAWRARGGGGRRGPWGGRRPAGPRRILWRLLSWRPGAGGRWGRPPGPAVGALCGPGTGRPRHYQ